MTLLKSKKPTRTIQEKEKLLQMMREPGIGEVKRVNANIPTKLHSKLKMYAYMDGKEIKEVLTDLIRNYVKKARERHLNVLNEINEEIEKSPNEDPS